MLAAREGRLDPASAMFGAGGTMLLKPRSA